MLNELAIAGKNKKGEPLGIANDQNPRFMAGGSWKKRQFTTRLSQKGAEKEKGLSTRVQNGAIHKGFFGKRSRSYKHPMYGQYCKLIDRLNQR